MSTIIDGVQDDGPETQNEQTPLLRKPTASIDSPPLVLRFKQRAKRIATSVFDVENRVLLTGFLITLSFSFTQVPIFYVFHSMTCDAFYDSHPPYQGPGERCSRDEIAAGTAVQISILGISTALCGTFNLFVTGWAVKKIGPRAALLFQTLIPALRVMVQILGLLAGKTVGMAIIQATQLITILGGPSGYILVVNIIAGEAVDSERRTIVFGKLQGAIMLGQGIGYLSGGMIGDAIDIKAPFLVAFGSFLLASIFVRSALPYIPPRSPSDDTKSGKKRGAISNFLAPLKILVPQKLSLSDGRLKSHYGIVFLCGGIFVGVLATGYVPLLIQMYATAAFNFNQHDNGLLMAEFSFMRSIFLLFMFPRIITFGRKLFNRPVASSASFPSPASDSEHTAVEEQSTQQLPTDPEAFPAASVEQIAGEPLEPVSARSGPHAHQFDLIFLRWSLVVDGALTTIAAFATKRWHIYLAALLLPLGSGSAPAAKGVITEMCPESGRADALNAVTLVENIALLSTLGLFGFLFAALSAQGSAYATFFCNATVAVGAMTILLFSRFPEADSRLVEENNNADEETDEQAAQGDQQGV